MTLISNGRRLVEFRYSSEKDFEDELVASARLLLGKNSIYINAKKKVDSKSLGAAVPDGFFFDFGDATDPQFYVVEVELSEHSFYNHVFPQITKFFAFFNNTKLQKSLVDKLFSVISNDDSLRGEFRKHLGSLEIYKFLSDIIESSKNILLIADGPIPELPEIMETYTDTWGKMVRYIEVRKYCSGGDTVFTVNPDFETLQYEGDQDSGKSDDDGLIHKYSEEYHLEDTNQNVRDIYARLKSIVGSVANGLIFNPQKYYISIKAEKNIAFIKLRVKKIRIIVMMPERESRDVIKNHQIAALGPSVQDFYNGPCAAVDIESTENMGEIETLIRKLVGRSRSAI